MENRRDEPSGCIPPLGLLATSQGWAGDPRRRLPSLEEVEARFAARRHLPPPPRLTPEGLAAMAAAVASGIPELNGPMDRADLSDDD
jgi:hypothetical protein